MEIGTLCFLFVLFAGILDLFAFSCPFVHLASSSSSSVCEFWMMGRCALGERCASRHPPNPHAEAACAALLHSSSRPQPPASSSHAAGARSRSRSRSASVHGSSSPHSSRHSSSHSRYDQGTENHRNERRSRSRGKDRRTLCRFYNPANRSGCRNGNECPFLHPDISSLPPVASPLSEVASSIIQQPSPPLICAYFARGVIFYTLIVSPRFYGLLICFHFLHFCWIVQIETAREATVVPTYIRKNSVVFCCFPHSSSSFHVPLI